MTLQVGMLGDNGVVLAGDMRVHRDPLAGINAPWQNYQGPKIQISDSGRIAVSCAHDMQVGKEVARAIFANMTHGDHPSCEREIKDIGSAAAQGRNVECIVTFVDPLAGKPPNPAMFTEVALLVVQLRTAAAPLLIVFG